MRDVSTVRKYYEYVRSTNSQSFFDIFHFHESLLDDVVNAMEDMIEPNPNPNPNPKSNSSPKPKSITNPRP
jgi:hypothetical protein